MIGPSRRLTAALLLCAVPWVLALGVPGLEALGSVAIIVLAALLVLDIVFSPPRAALDAEISLPAVLSLADEQPVRVRVRCRLGAARAGAVRVVFPEAWDVRRPVEAISLSAHGTSEAVFRVRPRRRGRYAVGPVFLRLPTPLGFFRRDYRLDAQAEVRVFPAIAAIRTYALLSRRLRAREMGMRPQRLRGLGLEFARLRPYLPGDDLRAIDWKATARRDRLVTREYQAERSQHIVLMIDAGRMLTEEVDGVVKFEYVLNAALLLTRVAAEYDDRVGAVVFSDTVERWTAPRKGRAAVSAMAETLYDVEPRLCEANYEAAFAHLNTRYRKRALVILFTNLVDQETSGLVSASLRALARRHIPLCVAVGDRETTEAAHAMPRDVEDVYRKGAAAHLLLARANTLQSLQRQGVHVIDAPAGRVPVELINRYLDLKARQLL